MLRPAICLHPGARVRRSPQFQVLGFSDLTPSEQAGIRSMIAPEKIAVLRPADNDWRRPQLVSPTMAAALAGLRRPVPWSSTAIPDATTTARLVLDGILELEGDDGFRTGPSAHDQLFPASRQTPPRHPLGRISMNALEYADALDATDPGLLAARLYNYNRLPLSPAWKRRLGTPAAITRLLAHDRRRPRDIRSTEIDTAAFGYAVWTVWDSTRPRPDTSGPTFKLYVSPSVDDLPAACAALRGEMTGRNGPFSVKVGRDLASLLRPDKLVGYFATRSDLRETAARLTNRLRGIAGQGVPFTAPIGAGLLLSWAVDPAHDPSDPASRFERSWRAWITARLGTALATAAAAPGSHRRLDFVRDRIALDGVNPRTWTVHDSRFHADH